MINKLGPNLPPIIWAKIPPHDLPASSRLEPRTTFNGNRSRALQGRPLAYKNLMSTNFSGYLSLGLFRIEEKLMKFHEAIVARRYPSVNSVALILINSVLL